MVLAEYIINCVHFFIHSLKKYIRPEFQFHFIPTPFKNRLIFVHLFQLIKQIFNYKYKIPTEKLRIVQISDFQLLNICHVLLQNYFYFALLLIRSYRLMLNLFLWGQKSSHLTFGLSAFLISYWTSHPLLVYWVGGQPCQNLPTTIWQIHMAPHPLLFFLLLRR